jgi:hypothetical protein
LKWGSNISASINVSFRKFEGVQKIKKGSKNNDHLFFHVGIKLLELNTHVHDLSSINLYLHFQFSLNKLHIQINS